MSADNSKRRVTEEDKRDEGIVDSDQITMHYSDCYRKQMTEGILIRHLIVSKEKFISSLPDNSAMKAFIHNFNTHNNLNNELKEDAKYKKIVRKLHTYNRKAKKIPTLLCRICEQTMPLSKYMVTPLRHQ
eukprot:TRINITY_DN10562_c0_g1_i3.p3 TRINITY_DN10562_c0_g1~~TRINITY_DN10562_c0_g1_i3.p3  ORF type:complete len:130 (+),score=18.08 TRINITY_DN10562_c0_g1_i3:134-523(+)